MTLIARPRPCIVCKRTRDAEHFHRYPYGTYATSCNDCRVVRPNGPKGVVRSPNPCKACGGPIMRDESPCRLLARKTCSPACADKARSKDQLVCYRCKRTLPFESFGKRPNGHGVKRSCFECDNDLAKDIYGGLVLRPSLHAFGLTMRKAARMRNAQFLLTKPQIAKLHQAECSLCGKAVSAVMLIDAQKGFVKDNVRPLCRVCRRLTRMVAHAELILLAHEIASYNPLIPQGGPPCPATNLRASKNCRRSSTEGNGSA